MSSDLIKRELNFPLDKYNKKSNVKSVSFIGTPSIHPYENDKFILITNPLSDHTEFYEFKIQDVVFIEELPVITTQDEKTIALKLFWIREGAVAIKMQPFVVSKTI